MTIRITTIASHGNTLRILRRLIKRFERFGILFTSDVDKASEVFERHGGKAILIGHSV